VEHEEVDSVVDDQVALAVAVGIGDRGDRLEVPDARQGLNEVQAALPVVEINVPGSAHAVADEIGRTVTVEVAGVITAVGESDRRRGDELRRFV